jgi:hypothetical protein
MVGEGLRSPAVDQIGERRLWIATCLTVMAAALWRCHTRGSRRRVADYPIVDLHDRGGDRNVAIDAYDRAARAWREGIANGVRVSA